MSALSDLSGNEDELDIVQEYENAASDDDQRYASDENNENEAEEVKPKRVDPSTSKKHIIRNPQPKLNTERLKGPKGIHMIEKYFEGFKFHGKGHEKGDLDRIMKRIEHWGHRLFPKLDYDDFLARMEVLGTKRDLQVFIRKYRMDMISADDDAISKELIEDDEEEKDDPAPIDEFDLLIAEQIEKQKQAAVHQESLNKSSNEDAFNQLLSTSTTQSTQLVKEKQNAPQLTDEVRARIERNRQQALERKMLRLKQREEEAKKKSVEEIVDMKESQEETGSNILENETKNSTEPSNGEDEKMTIDD